MDKPSLFAVIPESRPERWELLREFVNEWYPPLKPSDGDTADALDAAESRLGVPLPQALREWYEIAGRREDIWSQQDLLYPPERLEIEDDRLIFYVENQAVVQWGIRVSDLPLDDPPVFVSSIDECGVWIEENETTSMFALQMLLFCVKFAKCNPGWGNGCLNEAAIKAIESHYPRLPLAEWYWTGPTRFYGHRDLVVEIADNWLCVSGRTETAFRELVDLMDTADMDWTAISDEHSREWWIGEPTIFPPRDTDP